MKLWPVPQGDEEAVGAAVGGRYHLYFGPRQDRDNSVDRWHDFHVVLERPREVVANYPEVLNRHWVEGEDDHPLSSYAGHLFKTSPDVGPVMHGDDRHRRVEAVVLEGKRFGNALDHRCRTGRALFDHRLGGLYRSDITPAWLI